MIRWVVVGIVALFATITLAVLANAYGEALTLHFEGIFQSQRAQNTRNGLNYTDAANQQAESYMSQYQQATDTEHAKNLLSNFCTKAGSITAAQRHPAVQDFYLANCQ
jgi:Spy/CpxP family protein refolding chaperone